MGKQCGFCGCGHFCCSFIHFWLFVVGFGLVWLLWGFFGFVLFSSKKLSYAIQGRDQKEQNLLFWLCLQQTVLANFLWSQWPCVI